MSDQSLRSELEAVFASHRSKLKWVAKNILRSEELAEEVVQDAYLKVFSIAEIRKINQPLRYCYQVVRTLALDSYRHRCVEQAYQVFIEDMDSVMHPAGQTAGRTLDVRNALVQVDAVLATLAPRTRLAFELARISGMTQREIARKLGCSATLVNFMIKEADAALQSCRHFLYDN